MVSANHDLDKVAGLDSLDSTEIRQFLSKAQKQCIFKYRKQRRVVLPFKAIPGQSSPRLPVHHQSQKMVTPAETGRDHKERKRVPVESKDPTESIKSSNPPESPVSPQLELSRAFCDEEVKRE
jgi:hypothetical protein